MAALAATPRFCCRLLEGWAGCAGGWLPLLASRLSGCACQLRSSCSEALGSPCWVPQANCQKMRLLQRQLRLMSQQQRNLMQKNRSEASERRVTGAQRTAHLLLASFIKQVRRGRSVVALLQAAPPPLRLLRQLHTVVQV